MQQIKFLIMISYSVQEQGRVSLHQKDCELLEHLAGGLSLNLFGAELSLAS